MRPVPAQLFGLPPCQTYPRRPLLVAAPPPLPRTGPGRPRLTQAAWKRAGTGGRTCPAGRRSRLLAADSARRALGPGARPRVGFPESRLGPALLELNWESGVWNLTLSPHPHAWPCTHLCS